MFRLASSDLWPAIESLAAAAKHRLAAVAFVSSDVTIRFGRGDVLIVDASDASIAGGRTSASVLRAAHDRGAQVFSFEGLHAKVLCLDRHVVVGSSNISASSVESLVEAGIISDHPTLLAEARSFIAQAQASATQVDRAFLARIERIPVVRRDRGSSRRVHAPKDRRVRTWLVGVHALDESKYEDEAELVAEGQDAAQSKLEADGSGVSWIRFTGNSRFRKEAQPEDNVIQIWRSSTKAKRARVYYPAPIVLRQDEPTCTRLYVEDFADEDERAVPWSTFVDLWERVAGVQPPKMGTARLLDAAVAEALIAGWRAG